MNEAYIDPDVSTCGKLIAYLLTLPQDMPTYLIRSDGSAFRLKWQNVGISSIREADNIFDGSKAKDTKGVAFIWPHGLTKEQSNEHSTHQS